LPFALTLPDLVIDDRLLGHRKPLLEVFSDPRRK
jgi:hypothetical protein